MNHETFIRNQVTQGFDGADESVLEIANETIDRYRKDIFDTVVSLIREMRKKLGSKICLREWVTVKEFSAEMNMPNSTARAYLNKRVGQNKVRLDCEKKPFKYRAI